MTRPRFFKAENNTNAEEFKRFVPVGVQTTYTTMAPAIATAEQLRLKPYIGEKLFERAADYYAAHETADTTLDELVELIQTTVVRMALWDSFDQLAVMMTDKGMYDNQGDNRLYRYQADALRNSLQRQGYEWLNKTLGYCTEHIDELSEFEASQYYTDRQGSLIRSMAEYERFISLHGDFTVFAKLREWIDETEAMELEFRIGARLKEALISDREAARFNAIRRAAMAFVAHWSMGQAAPFLNLIPTAQGLTVVSEEGGQGQGGSVKNGATPEEVAAFSHTHREAAERYIGQLVTYCKAHGDLYPEIHDIGSSGDTEHSADLLDNDGRKTFTVL